MAIGVASLAYNLSQGNYGDAVIDAVGVAIDAAATITPGVPGGASSLIKLYRAGDVALEIAEVAVKHGDEIIEGASAVSQVMKNADEVVGAFCSFSADTRVATQDGNKPISELEVDEEVLAWNEATNEVGYYEVTDTFSHVDPVLTNLIINGEWIETTPEHPFYTLEEG